MQKSLKILRDSAGVKFYYAKTISEAKDIIKTSLTKYAIIDQNLKNENGLNFNKFLNNNEYELKTIFCSSTLDNIDRDKPK